MRKVVAAVLVLLLAVVGWWYASPLWTLHELRAASERRDAAEVSRYVDYPALRADLKAHLRSYVTAQADRDTGGSGGGVGAALALAVLGPAIDAAVSPAGVEAMLARQPQANGRGARSAAPVKAGNDPVIDRDGFDTFRVRDKDPAKGALVFHRYGVSWKLAGIDLPARRTAEEADGS